MKQFKISLLLTVLMSMASTAVSADDLSVNGIYYNYNDGSNGATVSVTYRGDSPYSYNNEYTGEVIIPESVTYNGKSYSVTSIGNNAFSGCSGLTSVTIPNSVTSIGNTAFYNCSRLTSVHISDLAAWCNISFGNGESNPLSFAHHLYLNGEEVKDLVIPNSVTSIGGYTFYGCSGLTSVTIPNSVTSIGSSAFNGCSGLTSVTIGNSVTSIGWSAFANCNLLTSVTIGNSVTSIGNYAFQYCSSLTSVTIPNSVTSIGNYAFQYCSSLTSVTIPNSLTSIGNYAFYNCSSLTSVHISDLAAWFRISFGTIESNPLTFAHHLYLNEEEIKELVVPISVTSIGKFVFSGCSGLTSVTIPNSVTSIGESAFRDCSKLKNIILPEGLQSIGNYLFSGCTSLVSVVFPSTLKTLSQYMFNGVASLKEVRMRSTTVPTNLNSFFYGVPSNFNIYAFTWYVPKGTYQSYEKIIPWWSGEKGGIREEGGTGHVVNFADPEAASVCLDKFDYNFDGFIDEEELSGVLTIKSLFSNNDRLQTFDELKYFTNVKSATYAFENCSSLTSVIIPDGFQMGDGNDSFTFKGCTNLSCPIVLPNSMTNIVYGAFWGCSSLTSVTIPNSVTSIGSNAFYGCSGLTSVVVERNSPISISSNTFSNSANATLYVPKGAKSAYQAANYWNSFKAIKEYPDGDVNQDGDTDVVDVVDIARYVVGTPGNTFDIFLADMNSDKAVNVTDAVVLVTEIAGDTNWARPMMPAYNGSNDVLTLSENDDHSLTLLLEGDGRYTAFQFDMYLPEGVDITQMQLNSQRKQKHQLLYNKVREGQWRVVALSTSNREFMGSSGELLNIVLDGFATDDILVDNIHFVTPQGVDVTFDAINLRKEGTPTRMDALPIESESPQTIYNLNGQRLNAPQKGLNIIDNKKVVIK